MKYKACLLIILATIFCTQTLFSQSCTALSINIFLDDIFSKQSPIKYDTTKFYSHTGKPKALYTPLLNKLMPDYCFYSAVFLSSYYEYPKVETAIAISRNKNKKSAIIHSPVFTQESEEFLKLFIGTQVTDSAQAILYCREIASIFSSITGKGTIRRVLNTNMKTVISYELWHYNISWRIYDFYFDSSHKLIEIKAESGAKKTK